MSSITELPDLVQRTIFSHLTPQDQLNARKVCIKWASLMASSTLKVTSLTLLIGTGNDHNQRWLEDSHQGDRVDHVGGLVNLNNRPLWPRNAIDPWNCLQIELLYEDTAQQILETFTSITRLQIAFGCTLELTLDYVTLLLEAWSHQLTDFKLAEGCDDENTRYPPSTVTRFYQAINSISTLKHLSLHLTSLPLCELPILTQLKTINFFSFSPPRKFVQQLQRFASTNTNLTAINFASGDLDPEGDHLNQLAKLDENLQYRFTRIDISPSSYRDVTFICDHFRNLMILELFPTHITFRRFVDALSQLKKLVHLTLDISARCIAPGPEDLEDPLFTQCPSIRSAYLRLRVFSNHEYLSSLHLDWTMPNVEQIQFAFFPSCQCTECDLTAFSADTLEINLDRGRHCLKQIFTPLHRSCSKLVCIRHNYESILGSAEEIIGEDDAT